jgi:Holliday junction DNA helicase RuvA
VLSRFRGTLVESEPTRVVLECAGVGFELKVPLSTSRRLPEVGAEAVLLVHTHFTRDGVELYGFADKSERDTFRRIISVRGVGPRAGLNLLSRFTPAEVKQAVASGRLDVVRSVPGIGPKKADAIIAEFTEEEPAGQTRLPLVADAEAALQSLGLSRREARDRLGRVQVTADMSLQELLKLALAHKG